MNDSRKNRWALIILVALIAIAGIAIYVTSLNQESSPASQNQTPGTQNIQATFTCDSGKSIDAVFMNATTSTTNSTGSGQATGNQVQLSLSDGRQMTLPQVISADGARYANSDESFVFWNVGNGATVWENGTTTFTNCTTQTS